MKIPVGRALLWVFLWTLAISGSAWMAWLYYLHLENLRMQDDQYRIIAVLQSSPQPEALKTVYFTELLNLSLDKPVNLYQLNVKEAEKILLASPLIKKAYVRKIRPGTLYIDYISRTPIAYLGDYTNTAIDEEGYLFPFSPFFTPKKLPIIYLGLEDTNNGWGISLLEDNRLKLAFELIKSIRKDFVLKRIDVSQAFAESYGQRQIVICLEENGKSNQTKTYLLRLNTAQYTQNLANYAVLRNYLDKSSLNSNYSIIDFRIPHLAFIKNLL